MSLFLLSNNETLKPLKKLFSLLHSVSTAAMLHSIATLALFHIKGKKSCQPYVYHVGVGALLRRASSHTTFAQLATARYTRSAGRFALPAKEPNPKIKEYKGNKQIVSKRVK